MRCLLGSSVGALVSVLADGGVKRIQDNKISVVPEFVFFVLFPRLFVFGFIFVFIFLFTVLVLFTFARPLLSRGGTLGSI